MRSRAWNLTNVLLWLGVAALGVSFWIPYASAERVARVEDRASEICAELLRAAVALAPTDLSDPEVGRRLVEDAAAGCERRGHPASAAPEIVAGAATPDALYVQGRHYLYLVTRTPEELPRPAGSGGRPLEVYCWPRSPLTPGRSTFFLAQDDRPSFTRNLRGRYMGMRSAPAAGDGRPRGSIEEVGAVRDDASYWGRDSERWLRY